MKSILIILMVVFLVGCSQHDEEEHSHHEEVSLFDEHEGLNLPEEIKRELAVEVVAVKDINCIPESAIVRGAQEDFAYVQRGKYLKRTPLKVGAATNGCMVVEEGLAVGDRIVTHPAKDLWLIELLAIRGGEPCCPVD